MLPLSDFLCQHSGSHHRVCSSVGFPSVLKVQLESTMGWLSLFRRGRGKALGKAFVE